MQQQVAMEVFAFLFLAEALFSSEKWKVFGTVALSFVCDKYYPIIEDQKICLVIYT
jgi:hypothetical protein